MDVFHQQFPKQDLNLLIYQLADSFIRAFHSYRVPGTPGLQELAEQHKGKKGPRCGKQLEN